MGMILVPRVLAVAATGRMLQTSHREAVVVLPQMVTAGNKTSARRLLVHSIQMLMESQVRARTVAELGEPPLRVDPAMVSGETESTYRVRPTLALNVNSSVFRMIPPSSRPASTLPIMTIFLLKRLATTSPSPQLSSRTLHWTTTFSQIST